MHVKYASDIAMLVRFRQEVHAFNFMMSKSTNPQIRLCGQDLYKLSKFSWSYIGKVEKSVNNEPKYSSKNKRRYYKSSLKERGREWIILNRYTWYLRRAPRSSFREFKYKFCSLWMVNSTSAITHMIIHTYETCKKPFFLLLFKIIHIYSNINRMYRMYYYLQYY